LKVIRYWKVSEGCRKECMKGPSLRLEVVSRSGGINPLKLFKVAQGVGEYRVIQGDRVLCHS
jgi:hypothetical protein